MCRFPSITAELHQCISYFCWIGEQLSGKDKSLYQRAVLVPPMYNISAPVHILRSAACHGIEVKVEDWPCEIQYLSRRVSWRPCLNSFGLVMKVNVCCSPMRLTLWLTPGIQQHSNHIAQWRPQNRAVPFDSSIWVAANGLYVTTTSTQVSTAGYWCKWAYCPCVGTTAGLSRGEVTYGFPPMEFTVNTPKNILNVLSSSIGKALSNIGRIRPQLSFSLHGWFILIVLWSAMYSVGWLFPCFSNLQAWWRATEHAFFAWCFVRRVDAVFFSCMCISLT